ncbi:hypothetical protein CWI36_0743p0020 [Hamiltosporidium magnivora]|uniref:Uncharacterized protein n=1 Tax=Hamiltosporidium magnivora TaxID=148818 RepID=A0A4Q9LA86_9MICR|nr:hypothetical protein CWI36_0743p0020 [Hamiltosporidium magnivora]
MIRLEIDKDRSATYRVFCEDTDTLIEGVSVCDYLEIIEDSNSNPTLSSFDEIKRLITRNPSYSNKKLLKVEYRLEEEVPKPTTPLKEANNDEDGLIGLKKNIISLISKEELQGGIVNVKDVKEVYKSHNDVLI